MVIIKFALFFFLIFMTMTLVQSQGQGPLQGGPFYFLYMPGSRNPVQPKYRLNGWRAFPPAQCLAHLVRRQRAAGGPAALPGRQRHPQDPAVLGQKWPSMAMDGF